MRKVKFRINAKVFITLWIIVTIVFFVYVFLPRRYDYIFHVPETDVYVFTKKVWGGKFYVMFSDKKKSRLSPDVDYVEVTTGAYMRIIFDGNNRKNITIFSEHEPVKTNSVNFSIREAKYETRGQYIYYGNEYYDENGKFKSPPYVIMSVETREYNICLDGKDLHIGGIFGR